MMPTSRSCLLGTVLISLLYSSISAIDLPKDYKLENLLHPPIIIREPRQKYVAYPNDEILLHCEAKKNSKAQYRWEKDGKEFDLNNNPRLSLVPNTGTLNISYVNGNMMDFSGKYRCFAFNHLGTAITHEITFIPESTPKWQKETIKPIEVEEGESVILPCNSPKSAVPPRLLWMNSTLLHITQDNRVSMGSNGYLYFSNVKPQDEHPDYICHAQFIGARTIVSQEPIALRVTPTNSLKFRKPEMMMPMGTESKHLALKGESLQLECIAKGLPTPENEWLSLTGSMPEKRFHFDEFKKNLRIDNVQFEDDGQYQCTAKNSEGKVQHTYIVTVEAAPYWINEPKNTIYGPGENAVLTCDVDGKPKPSVTWKINGEPLKDSDFNENRELKEDTLILRDLRLSDTLVVQCEARNIHGYILANAYVFVVELPPRILTQDEIVYNVVENADIAMKCRAFAAPVPAISWQDETMNNVLVDQRFTIKADGNLIISEVQKDDTGIYTCTATNIKGSVNISAILSVKNATSIIISPPKEQRVKKGWKAIFQCKALFDSTLENTRVEWKKDETDIKVPDDSDKYFIDVNYTLSITNVQESDQGTYKCVARTDLDVEERTADLIVMDIPESPYDLEFVKEDDLAVTLSWTPGNENNSPVKEFIIEYEEDRFESGVWHELTRVSGDESNTRLDLSPHVNYQFRVRAVNEIGPSNGSNPSDRFQTPPAAPTKNPREVKGEGTESNNMYISWKPLKGIDWNGEGFTYLVRWRRQGLEETWYEQKVQSPPIVVRNTETFVPYEIKVQAFNDHGKASEPKTVIGHSGEDYPESVPENVGLESMNESTIKVAWLPMQKERLNGHLKGFKVLCIGHGGRPHTETVVRGNTTHALISGLQPFSNYSVKVRVFNGKGDGIYSDAVSIRTDEGVPSKPSFLNLERLSDTSLTLVWGPPDTPNGILTGYEIYYQIVSSTKTEETFFSQTINDPQQQNWTVTNISSNYTYRFFVYATTSAGQGEPALKEGGTMQEIEFPPSMNVSLQTESRRIMITWEAKKNVELKVQIKNKSNDIWDTHGKVNTSQTVYELNELSPGTTYDIRLMATFHSTDVNIWNTTVVTSGVAITTEPRSFVTERWFIGLICAIVMLLLILIVLCFIKRSKGGKYSVKDKEDTQVDSEARPMKDETFGEYSDNDEKPFTSSQPSLNGDIKPLGSDDSLADYGGSVDVQFNEDGSFIGQYSGKKEKEAPGANDSSGATSPVIPSIPVE